MLKKIAVIIALGLAFVPSSVMAEGPKIGIVNLREIFSQYDEVQKSSESLKTEVENQQKIIDERKSEITALTEELDKQEIVLSKEEKEKREDIIDAKVKALQDFVIEVNQNIKGMEGKIKEGIIDKILEAVKQVGDEDKYDIILEKNDKIVLYSLDSLDITAKVIQKLTAQKK